MILSTLYIPYNSKLYYSHVCRNFQQQRRIFLLLQICRLGLYLKEG